MSEEKEDLENIKVSLPGITTDKKIPQRKLDYGEKLKSILREYKTCLVVGVTNVGSRQVADLRKHLRGKARFLFGKNTMIRKVIRDYVKETGEQKWKNLMDVAKGNTGFCFIKGNIAEMAKTLLAEKKNCAAKPGVVAPVDVFVPAGPTGMEPTQTQFFQAMDIPTRINRGQIDITDPVQVIFKGQKVGASQAALLIKLGIKPFYYGLSVISVYDDGTVFDAEVLNIDDDDIATAVFGGLRKMAALCFTMDYPNITTVPHSLMNAYKKVVSLGLNFEGYSWEGLDNIKKILANPGAAQAVAAPGGAGEAAPIKEPTPEKESEAAPTGLFGGDDDESSEEEEESD